MIKNYPISSYIFYMCHVFAAGKCLTLSEKEAMGINKTYVQQLCYDGEKYVKGTVVDLFEKFRIYCDVPFKLFPETKELVTREWPGEDGRDVYIPKKIPLASYDMDVECMYKGDDKKMRDNIESFLKYMYGRNDGAIGGRLAVYDEYTKLGRKDIHLTEVSEDIYYDVDYDDEQCAKFKIKLTVEDPSTDVLPVEVSGKVTDLNFN